MLKVKIVAESNCLTDAQRIQGFIDSPYSAELDVLDSTTLVGAESFIVVVNDSSKIEPDVLEKLRIFSASKTPILFVSAKLDANRSENLSLVNHQGVHGLQDANLRKIIDRFLGFNHSASPRIFLSYSREDLEVSRELAARLRAKNMSVFQDVSGLSPGERWWPQLLNEILISDAIIFLISRASIASKTCAEEVEHAVTSGKRILPVLLDNSISIVNDLPEGLSALHVASSRSNPLDLDNLALQVAEWVKEDFIIHRRLGKIIEDAATWASSEGDTSLLYGEDAIRAAEAVAELASRKGFASSRQVKTFLDSSREYTDDQRLKFRQIVQRSFVLPIRSAIQKYQSASALRHLAYASALTDDLDFCLDAESSELNRHALWRAGALTVQHRIIGNHSIDVNGWCEFSSCGKFLFVKAFGLFASFSASFRLGVWCVEGRRLLSEEMHSFENCVYYHFCNTSGRLTCIFEDGFVRAWSLRYNFLLGEKLIEGKKPIFADVVGFGVFIVYSDDGNFERVMIDDSGITYSVVNGPKLPVEKFCVGGSQSEVALLSGVDVFISKFDGDTFQKAHGVGKIENSSIINLFQSLPWDNSFIIVDNCVCAIFSREFKGRRVIFEHMMGICYAKVDFQEKRVFIGLGNGGWFLLDICSAEIVSRNDASQKSIGGQEFFVNNGNIQFDVHFASGKAVMEVDQGVIRVFDLWAGKTETLICDDTDTKHGLAISRDGRTLASIAFSGSLKFWDLRCGYDVYLRTFDGGLAGTTVFPNGNLHIFTQSGESILFDPLSGGVARNSSVFGAETIEVRVSADNRDAVVLDASGFCVLSGDDFRSRRFEVANDEFKFSYPDKKSFQGVAISPSGRLVAADEGWSAYVWDVETGRQLLAAHEFQKSVWSMIFLEPEQLFVVGCRDQTVRGYDLVKGNMEFELFEHGGAIYGLDYDSNSNLLVFGSADGEATVWDIQGNKKIARFSEHGDSINFVKFSPDGKFVVSGCEDGVVCVWETRTGALLLYSHVPFLSLKDAHWCNEGRLIVVLSRNGEISSLDVSRLFALREGRGFYVGAALSDGVGAAFDDDREDLLMQEVPEDLAAFYFRRLQERLVRESSIGQRASREIVSNKIFNCRTVLRAALDERCYLPKSSRHRAIKLN